MNGEVLLAKVGRQIEEKLNNPPITYKGSRAVDCIALFSDGTGNTILLKMYWTSNELSCQALISAEGTTVFKLVSFACTLVHSLCR